MGLVPVMKQVLIRQGRAVIEEMPAPACGRGEILVRSAWSLISTGTETSTLRTSAPEPAGTLWTRRVRKVGEVVRMVQERGWTDARAAIGARLEGESRVTGYSLAGTILEVGASIRDLVPGQRVACAGAGSAHHAEVVAVPRNLAVPVPEGVALREASSVTLGAIALQGVRQADLRLGETACVVGLGLLGRLTAALLHASGVRVIGCDTSASRVEAALGSGISDAFVVGRDAIEPAIDRLTAGHGADAVLLTAGTTSSEPVRQAFRLVRRKGRVVIVGAVGLDLEREAFYMKEAELRISCSYGPGRYDPLYETDGIDYPFGFVRWTENRNMGAYLDLVASGRIPARELLDEDVDVEQAEAAYARLASGGSDAPLAILLRYPAAREEAPARAAPSRRIPVVPRTKESGIRVLLVGPGSFASEVHLPNLAALGSAASLHGVVGRTAIAARETARRFAAPVAGTDLDEALRDPEVDLVLVSTRHDLHAEQATRALGAGKAVFVEKPAALDLPSLAALEEAIARSGRPFVVGFNRRFAPDVLALRDALSKRRGPLAAIYRVNAGRLPAGHWANGPEGGGRLVGEGCHMIDLLRHLVGSRRVAHAIHVAVPPAGRGDLVLGENFSLTCAHADGSVSTLVYTSEGNPGTGKERLELHWDGVSAVIDDFKSLRTEGLGGLAADRPAPDKGHRELLRRFVAHVAGTGDEPIPLPELLDVSRFALELDREIRGGAPAAAER